MSKLTKKLMCLVASIMVSFTMISSSALAKNKLELSSDTESVEEAQVSNHGLPDSIDDGVILHAWNWSFNNIRKNMKEIAEAGYNTIQTSPAQACRLGETWKKADLEQTNDKPTWYYLYQPTYFTLGNDYLGTAEEFKAMCETAHKYGVKIIVDVVANHLANCGSEHKDKVDTELYDEARKCSGLDDPNRITGSQYGFCLRQATGYVMWQEEVKGKDEIRGDGANRDPGVTNVALDMVQGSWSPDGLTAEWVKNPTSIPEGTQWSMDNISNDKYVSWVESHDLYANAGATRCMDTPRREVAWALMTARDKVVPLFFNRPVDTDFGSNANSPQGEAYKTMGERCSDDFASKNVVAVNRFHNAMVGQAEKISTAQGNGNGGDPKILVVNRGNKGTAIINTGRDSEFEVESSLPDGTYENQAESGGSFNVSGGRVSGKISANGIIVLYTPEDINFDDVKDDDSDIKDDDSKKDDAKKDDEEAILKINSIKASKNEANVSDDITITVNATGTNLKYKLSEIVDNDEQDYTSFIKKNSFTWSSDEVGKHVLKVSVTDGQKTVTKNITINIVDPNVSDKELSVVLNSTSKTISLGDSISLSATASDYSGICKYLFKYKKSTDSWEDGHNISSGYTSANKVKWEAPEEAGKYDVIVYVKDSEGNTAESESVRYTIKESESKDNDTSDSSDSTLVLLISLTMMLSLMGMVKTYKNNN